jgi:predicted nucleic acid-binding protein
MALLIDSSVLVELERRRLRLSALAHLVPDAPIALASITASELLAGAHRADTPARRVVREAFVEALLEVVPVLPFDLRTARVHTRLSAQLASVGQPVGAHDLLIAATAIACGYAVLTHNLRDFTRIPGLIAQRPDWRADSSEC